MGHALDDEEYLTGRVRNRLGSYQYQGRDRQQRQDSATNHRNKSPGAKQSAPLFSAALCSGECEHAHHNQKRPNEKGNQVSDSHPCTETRTGSMPQLRSQNT